MALQADNALCHLLCMPYEILRPILHDLSQRDQIKIAKTCVTLWKLAYPLAYNRLVIEIDPETKESAYIALASGVGLSYVQHLEINLRYEVEDSPRNIIEVVAGAVIAHLRRDSLLSFSLTARAHDHIAIGVRNVAVLVETQHQLRRLVLPQFSGSPQFDCRGYQRPNVALDSLQELTLKISPAEFAKQVRWLVRLSPNANVHFHVDSSSVEGPWRRWAMMGNLFSLATRLTLHGIDFLSLSLYWDRLHLPALCALALRHCTSEFVFFSSVESTKCPRLTALKMDTKSSTYMPFLDGFVRGLVNLRELCICSGYLRPDEALNIISQVPTLELLSMACGKEGQFRRVGINMQELLESVPDLRLLSMSLGGVDLLRQTRKFKKLDADFENSLRSLKAARNIQTLHIRCVTYVFDRQQTFSQQESTLIENRIGSMVLEQLGIQSSFSHNSVPLKFLSVSNQIRTMRPELSVVSCDELELSPQIPKRMYSTEPDICFRSGEAVKADILHKHAADGYYFLEDFANGMLDISSSTSSI
ncbi:hypothetical protein T440DRAFT_267145 [Plenodomus tracheiphilus IPT5]|uniref:F-box domain-containing protein n=1 Tax=Plenodomus tracheiphilus IPT5 TaxID=1408161 RepID=A0A6A7BFB2_9PLEO|nr:hypothetical protein T440DRAFT_267145 [Plenodomus tracheiphilus IPT5]